MTQPWIHPRDLVGATRDDAALRRPRPERARHLNADDDDAWLPLPRWIDIPLGPQVREHPIRAAIVGASLLLFIVAPVLL